MHLKIFSSNLILFLLLLFGHAIIAQQQGKIIGKIIGKDGTPLEFVNVGLAGSSLGDVTNVEGQFTIDGVNLGNHILIASMIGFETIKKEVAVCCIFSKCELD